MKRFVLAGFVLALTCMTAGAYNKTKITMAKAATTTGAQAWFGITAPPHTFLCAMTVTSGSGTATVTLEAAMAAFPTGIVTVNSMSVTDTAAATYVDSYSTYDLYRVHITAISGTGAAVSCFGGA
jgi:hypothetical protein